MSVGRRLLFLVLIWILLATVLDNFVSKKDIKQTNFFSMFGVWLCLSFLFLILFLFVAQNFILVVVLCWIYWKVASRWKPASRWTHLIWQYSIVELTACMQKQNSMLILDYPLELRKGHFLGGFKFSFQNKPCLWLVNCDSFKKEILCLLYDAFVSYLQISILWLIKFQFRPTCQRKLLTTWIRWVPEYQT